MGAGPLYVPMKRLINQFSSLRYLALQKRELARIPVDYDSNTKELVAILSPQLEHECYKVEDLPKDPGIYSYLQGSEIVYYGRGKDIHNRGLEHKEKNWQFDSIKYSFVPDEQKRVFYENQFLEKYKSQNGTLPRYNLISGSSKFDKVMEAA